jgi:hypothetical protein
MRVRIHELRTSVGKKNTRALHPPLGPGATLHPPPAQAPDWRDLLLPRCPFPAGSRSAPPFETMSFDGGVRVCHMVQYIIASFWKSISRRRLPHANAVCVRRAPVSETDSQ